MARPERESRPGYRRRLWVMRDIDGYRFKVEGPNPGESAEGNGIIEEGKAIAAAEACALAYGDILEDSCGRL